MTVRRQCIAPSNQGRQCRNMVVSPKVICAVHHDMTLYRVHYPPVDDGTADVKHAEEAWYYIRWLKESGYLVPVEPCEHGCYDTHAYTTDGTVKTFVVPTENMAICDGAGLEDTT